MSDDFLESDREYDISAEYKNGYATLWVDGEVVAEGERNWNPAEGGLVSLMTGSHNPEAPKDSPDTGLTGIQWVSDLNICSNAGKHHRRMKKVIAKFDDYIDEPELSRYDAGYMTGSIIMSCGCRLDQAGTLLHYGGNNEDSWMAGYILYWGNDQWIWGIQMNANDSGPALVVDGYGPGEYAHRHIQGWPCRVVD